MNTSEGLSTVIAFRSSLHNCFGKRADALFELVDTVLTADTVPSLVHLSLEASHRRGWGSLYAALRHRQVDTEALRSLLDRHPLDVVSPSTRSTSASGRAAMPRPVPSAAITITPPATPMANRHPLPRVPGAGWAYQWIAQISFERNSWTAPLDVQRVHPFDDASAVASRQIKAFVHTLPADELSTPVFVFDAGYDPVALALGLETTPTAILVRLRSNRCFYADPRGSIGNGRLRRHGARFACKDAATWPEPTSKYTCDDPRYGQVRVRAWAGLHSVVKVNQTLGSHKPRPIVRGFVVLVEVAKLPGQTRKPRMLWLFWHGPGEPDLSIVWQAYIRRFDLEHTIRFSKQTSAGQCPGSAGPRRQIAGASWS